MNTTRRSSAKRCTAPMRSAVAGGVPAMCDGVTQGQDGMELSLLSREVIAMSAAIGLSHNMFDGALYLGVCDKIVPGLTMAALSFGHLPSVFIPSGPMASGLPNKERFAFASCMQKGKLTVWRSRVRSRLLSRAGDLYFLRNGEHQPDGGRIYGHAAAGLVLCPSGCSAAGSADRRRRAPVTRMTGNGNEWMPLGKMFDEKWWSTASWRCWRPVAPPTTLCTGGDGPRGGNYH